MQQGLAAGVRFFQYRSKKASRRSIYDISVLLAPIARDAGALFIVNDHADIAAAANADGVNLGQDDLPLEYARSILSSGKIIGVSTHNIAQARAAEAAGADYIGFGPIFKTSTKDAGHTQGIGNLTVIKHSVAIPVIAIGGINQANMQFVAQIGAAGAAVISIVLSAPDITFAADQLVRTWMNESLPQNTEAKPKS